MAGDKPMTTHDLVADRDRSGDDGRRADSRGASDGPLLPKDSMDDFRARWEEIQARFVDDPRRTVEDADALVAELMREIADSFSREREALENQWDRGESVDTEDLRTALQRYRDFFNRLLST